MNSSIVPQNEKKSSPPGRKQDQVSGREKGKKGPAQGERPACRRIPFKHGFPRIKWIKKIFQERVQP
ncbi:MAG: hypothetical protein ACI4UF_02405, partial [Thermoguttaceae bacterium]